MLDDDHANSAPIGVFQALLIFLCNVFLRNDSALQDNRFLRSRDCAQHVAASRAARARRAGEVDALLFNALFREPRKGECFDFLRGHAVVVGCLNARVWQQLAKSRHECRVVRTAAANDHGFGLVCIARDVIANAPRSEFEQRSLHVRGCAVIESFAQPRRVK
jgi:hypothetical protein